MLLCLEVIKEKGLEHVTVEDLVTEVTPKGRGTRACCKNGPVLCSVLRAVSPPFSPGPGQRQEGTVAENQGLSCSTCNLVNLCLRKFRTQILPVFLVHNTQSLVFIILYCAFIEI